MSWAEQSNLFNFYSAREQFTSEHSFSSSFEIFPQKKQLVINKVNGSINNDNNSSRCPLRVSVNRDEHCLLIRNFKVEYTPYMVINSTYFSNELGYQLHEGDVILFGAIRFKIIELCSAPDNFEEDRLDEEEDWDKEKISNNNLNIENNENDSKSNNSIKCRICLIGEIDEENNPLITPCKCSGSVQYIHVQCLKQWLKSKVLIKDYKYFTVIIKKKFECEICKENLPDALLINNKLINLFTYKKPKNDYLIWESIPLNLTPEELNDAKYFYIIKFDHKTTITVGRSNNSDIKMSDPSISRNHSVMILDSNKFYLQDLNSKFGTMIELKRNILFLPNKPFSVQINKYYLYFELVRTFFGLIKCYQNKSFRWRDYNSYINENEIEIKRKEISNLHNSKVVEMPSSRSKNEGTKSKTSTMRELVEMGNTTMNNVNNVSNINLLVSRRGDPTLSITQDIPRENDVIGRLLVVRGKEENKAINQEENQVNKSNLEENQSNIIEVHGNDNEEEEDNKEESEEEVKKEEQKSSNIVQKDEVNKAIEEKKYIKEERRIEINEEISIGKEKGKIGKINEEFSKNKDDKSSKKPRQYQAEIVNSQPIQENLSNEHYIQFEHFETEPKENKVEYQIKSDSKVKEDKIVIDKMFSSNEKKDIINNFFESDKHSDTTLEIQQKKDIIEKFFEKDAQNGDLLNNNVHKEVDAPFEIVNEKKEDMQNVPNININKLNENIVIETNKIEDEGKLQHLEEINNKKEVIDKLFEKESIRISEPEEKKGEITQLFDTNEKPIQIDEQEIKCKLENIDNSDKINDNNKIEIINDLFASNSSKMDI